MILMFSYRGYQQDVFVLFLVNYFFGCFLNEKKGVFQVEVDKLLKLIGGVIKKVVIGGYVGVSDG